MDLNGKIFFIFSSVCSIDRFFERCCEFQAMYGYGQVKSLNLFCLVCFCLYIDGYRYRYRDIDIDIDMHKCRASYPNNYKQNLLKNGEHAIFLFNKNCSLLEKLTLPCLIVRGCEFLVGLELYEKVTIFPQSTRCRDLSDLIGRTDCN